MYGYDEDQYGDRERNRREEQRLQTFPGTCTELIASVQDIITVDFKNNVVDVDILLDILTDQGVEEETLELHAVRRIKKQGYSTMQMGKLLDLMKRYIQQLPLKDNVEKWWMSFKSAGNGGGEKSFQAKKLIEYMGRMQGVKALTKEQEQMFKYRNDWTRNQLSKACKQSS